MHSDTNTYFRICPSMHTFLSVFTGTMGRSKKESRKVGNFSKEQMKGAVEETLKGKLSMRSIAKKYDLSVKTLSRLVLKT